MYARYEIARQYIINQRRKRAIREAKIRAYIMAGFMAATVAFVIIFGKIYH